MMTVRITILFFLLSIGLYAQNGYNGLNSNMGNLYMLSNAKTRSISPENFTGEKGKGGMADPIADKDKPNRANSASQARDLGQGWKVNPYIKIAPEEIFTLAEIDGPGAIQHIWMTPTGNWRFSIIRIYWDDEKEPSVECPVGDFFCMGWGEYAPLSSLAVCVNPGSAFNCYWTMPFRKKCRITMENVNDQESMNLYYQIDYTLTDVPTDAAYFHAQWRRTNPNSTSDYTIVDGIKGKGHFVGLYLAQGVNNNGWWGEGEIKFFMDGDKKYPTICGTGCEDYFCGSYNFDRGGQYKEFSTPYSGLHQVICPDGAYRSQQRFGMFRWHITDPIRFEKELKITIQDLGWRNGGRYLPQKSDMASVAFWYQTEPHAPFPAFPSWEELEVN
ncbi:glycoside hydrolase family 172 protein [Dysgonomonas massiliensis]|uniref:glycoside hydrolase family 172 protein n=1 Tax=Dysgonomonas massiliensis TaxID=2040292 RepID=UPI000C75F839|nr:glycoside hydrolase family 172 protein [Dysgonomonas massiliensis]